MSEKPPPKETPQTAEEREEEENARYEWWMANNPVAKIPQASPEAHEEKTVKAKCEVMMDKFEQMFDLDALRVITQFSSKEERRSSPRQPALEALSLMFMLLKYLDAQEAFQRETRDALGARYETLSQAVGNITKDKNGIIFDIVVHDRRTPFPN